MRQKNENNEEIEEETDRMSKDCVWTVDGIGDSGAIMISESLKVNTTLTKLDLSSAIES